MAAVNLSKIYFLKNAKKTCKPNNRDLNRDWVNPVEQHRVHKIKLYAHQGPVSC